MLSGVAQASTAAKKAPVKLSGKVNNKGTGATEGTKAELEADDYYFQDTFIKAPKGKTITVTLENEGSQQHNFSIDSQNVDKDVAAGKKITVKVKIPKNGKPVAVYCKFHKSLGMQMAFFSKAGTKAKSTSTDSSGGSSGYNY
jgi:plastocyanin